MLQTASLKFAYPGGATISFPDIALEQGGTLLLQGASGSGKSTLLALCSGLLAAQHGKIEVARQDLTVLRGAQLDAWRGRAVGFLPQKLHLSESLIVRDNLALVFFAAGLPEDAQKINAALQALGVSDLAHRKPSALSGGQAQRVALARAVLLSPQIIFADEPTASLDDDAAAQATSLLISAAKRCGASLVIATHDGRVKTSFFQTAQRVDLQKLSQIGIQPANNMRGVL